jgi:PIN domain nuclease of toxin-antitoxin system
MLRLLLDTHAFIAWDDNTLPKRTVKAIQSADEVHVSAATAWEIAIKSGTGKLERRASVLKALLDYDFRELSLGMYPSRRVCTRASRHSSRSFRSHPRCSSSM